MKIQEQITVGLSSTDVSEIVKSYLENQGYEVENITMNVSSRIEGYGMFEHEVKSFSGASCKVKRKIDNG